MRILVSGTIRTVRELSGRYADRLGILLAPANRNSVRSVVATGLPFAIDNGAYSGGLDEKRFLCLLECCQGQPGCLFVVAPDIVADAKATRLGCIVETRGTHGRFTTECHANPEGEWHA